MTVGCNVRTWYRWENGLSLPLPIYRAKLIGLIPDVKKLV